MRQNQGFQWFSIFFAILGLTILSCQGAARGFNLFATETPTATNTFTPTPTFTVTPSPTSTLTSTPTPRPTGMVIEKQTDGTSLVIDYDNRYQFLLPENWKVVFSSQEDLEQAIQRNSENDPEFAKMAESFKDVNPNIFRLAALNSDRNYVHADFPILLTINAYANSIASTMPMEFVTAMIEDNILQGATSTSWDVVNNGNKVEVGIVKGTRTLNITNEFSPNVHELVIAFQSNKKLIAIEIGAPEQFAEQIFASFENIIDSIKVDVQ